MRQRDRSSSSTSRTAQGVTVQRCSVRPSRSSSRGVGERSGNLEQTLTVIGDYFDNEVSVTTQRLLSLLEPAITIALAVITVILLLAVYLPMFTMYGSLI